MAYIDNSEIKSILKDTTYDVCPNNIVLEFDKYLNSLPWAASTLKWDSIKNHQELNLSKVKDEEILSWVSRQPIGYHSHIVIWYSDKEPALILERDFAISNLFLLYSSAPGSRFMFGANKKDDSGFDFRMSDFLEFNGGDFLRSGSA